MSQAQKRKEKMKKKTNERANDTQGHRGFSTDQRISIESMNINKKRLMHQQNETRLVGLSIQEAAIRNQIESAESRAVQRCPKYTKSNPYWKRVDELIEEQNQVVKAIKEHSQSLINNDITQSTQSFSNDVSDFLNQESPVKKRKYEELVESSDEIEAVVLDMSDDDDEGLNVKKEKMSKATKKGGVSKGKKRK